MSQLTLGPNRGPLGPDRIPRGSGTRSADNKLSHMCAIGFRKIIDFADLPGSWSFVTLSADWNGSPLVLFAEGKPPQPDEAAIAADPWVSTRWYRMAAKAHHVAYLHGSDVRTICFERRDEIRPFHIQRLIEGWLLAEIRDGRGAIYDQCGHFIRSIDLGDGIQDIQTSPDGQIWVSYFDEGVYGDGIGKYGAVCFDSHGNPQFKYGEFAEQRGLPFISDCYAMNVSGTGDVWLNYYTDFPLVHLRDFALEKVWDEFGAMGKGFAVRDEDVVYLREGRLCSISLQSGKDAEIYRVEDESGVSLPQLPKRSLEYACRGPHLVMCIGSAVYSSL